MNTCLKHLVVGIDVGSSRTKAVAYEGSKIVAMKTIENGDISKTAQAILKLVLAETQVRSEELKQVALSGSGRSRLAPDTFIGLPVTMVDEIRAIGLGGLELSEKQHALIVSMGTGTALVVASDGGRKIEHVGGTGVGGGTIEGLSRRVLGVEMFEEAEKMAFRGKTSNVDLIVSDLTLDSVGMLPKYATASNFKKLDVKSQKDDVAAAIFNMVSEVIGIVTVMAAKAFHCEEEVVLTGKLAQSKKIVERIDSVTELFKIRISVQTNCEYCVAIGAAKSVI